MKIFFIISLCIATVSADCKGLYLKDDYYHVDIVKDSVNRVHQLAYNRNDNAAYFIFEDIAKEVTTHLGYVNLNPGRVSGAVNGTKNARTVAIDQNLNKIYVGGPNGITVIDKNNNVTAKLAVNDKIESLFLKDVIYFVNDKKEAYKFDFVSVTRIPELINQAVDKIVVSNDDNILFLKGSNIFRVKIGETEIVSAGDHTVNDIATNYMFKPYIITSDGFYEYNSKKQMFDKVAGLKDLRKLAFVYDNEPLYVVVDTIVKLVHQDIPCFGD